MTLADCIRDAARQLRQAGIDTPERDARLLVGAALSLAPLDIIARPDMAVPEKGAARAADYIRRRLAREPVSRILGRREFYGRMFRVTPDTLDPRPDTETLVELALEIADAEGWRSRPIRILDVGTGTGCILLTLLAELPFATGLGVDISPAALEIARENAGRLGLEDRVSFSLGRSLTGISETFDLLLANPPYIPSGDIAALEPEVRKHDPLAALDGGNDGLDLYREISSGMVEVVPRGWAILEVGAGQAGAVRGLLDGPHVAASRQKSDLAGHIRCVAVRTQR